MGTTTHYQVRCAERGIPLGRTPRRRGARTEVPEPTWREPIHFLDSLGAWIARQRGGSTSSGTSGSPSSRARTAQPSRATVSTRTRHAAAGRWSRETLTGTRPRGRGCVQCQLGHRDGDDPLLSVNYHLLIPCNMRCRGCFATFHDVRSGVPAGMLPKDQSLELVNALAMSFEEVTFAGGEPTLCPWLPELIAAAKSRGRTTMLVTNGTRLTDSFLDAVAGALDWVTLSIDSVDPEVHVALGRAVNGRALSAQRYVEIAAAAKRRGLGLKVNTVVSALNADQDFTDFLRAIGPSRWKALQVLPVDGQNDGSVEGLLIERGRFLAFCARHDHLTHDGIEVVPEDNDAIYGQLRDGGPRGPVLRQQRRPASVQRPDPGGGAEGGLGQVTFHEDWFYDRGGVYNWTKG